MILTDILNLFGLILNIVGAYLIFRNSPVNIGQLFMYSDSTRPQREDRAKKLNDKVRNGMLLIFIGFVCQFFALLASMINTY